MSNQLSLMVFGGLEPSVFNAKALNDPKNQAVQIGTAVSLGKRKDIATLLNLKGKENKDALDAAIVTARSNAFKLVKAELANYDESHLLSRMSVKTVKDGTKRIILAIDQPKKKVVVMDPAVIAKQIGQPIEQVKAWIAAQQAKNPLIDIQQVPGKFVTHITRDDLKACFEIDNPKQVDLSKISDERIAAILQEAQEKAGQLSKEDQEVEVIARLEDEAMTDTGDKAE